jgi:hypothetical protein
VSCRVAIKTDEVNKTRDSRAISKWGKNFNRWQSLLGSACRSQNRKTLTRERKQTLPTVNFHSRFSWRNFFTPHAENQAI